MDGGLFTLVDAADFGTTLGEVYLKLVDALVFFYFNLVPNISAKCYCDCSMFSEICANGAAGSRSFKSSVMFRDYLFIM